jgi:hypothetical protein
MCFMFELTPVGLSSFPLSSADGDYDVTVSLKVARPVVCSAAVRSVTVAETRRLPVLVCQRGDYW